MNRESRLSENSIIYYDIIASDNQIMKYNTIRNRLKKKFDIFYFEIETIELIDSFPYLVIREIYDYADFHKNKR
jgi:hypothetical protein